MRVLLSTIGSRGDVQPLVALACKLRLLGHEPRLVVPPDFCEWIAGLGFPVTPIGPELRKITAPSSAAAPAPFTPERRRQLAEGTVATQFDTISAAARDCDAIVGATALQIAARSVAELLGIPYYFAAYSPNVLPSPHHPPPVLPPMPGQAPASVELDNSELWARDRQRFNDLFGPALNSHRTARGLAPVTDVRSHVFTDRPWLAADAALSPWPDPDDHPVFQTGAWILPDERPLSAEVEAFLDAGAPPVYFGFGSVRAPYSTSEVMIESARAVGRRAIVSRGWADPSFVDNAADVLAIDEVNLQALLPRVAAAVHHGGAGTTTLVALAAVPQVVIPQVYDQHYWAQRIRALGIGVAHAPGTPTVESLTRALVAALRPEIAGRGNALAPLVRTDGAKVAAEALARN